MNLGILSANSSTKELSRVCPALRPRVSVTFRSLFLPERSTTMPLESSTRSFGGITEPSRAAWEGR